MENELINYISKYIKLSEEEEQAIGELITVKHFRKGTILLKEGELAIEGYFVIKGCIRQYYLVDGEEKTTAFYTDEQSVPSVSNPDKVSPSPSYLACVEDTMAAICYPDRAMEMFQKYPRFESVCLLIAEEDLSKAQESLASFVTCTPEERYLNLLKNRPDLVNRVPQYQLASYLGIKPETLSRIRKRIMVNAQAATAEHFTAQPAQ